MVARPQQQDPAVITADQYDDEQTREWTTYRALTAIDFHGVRAYNAGDPVPVSAVDGPDAWVFDDLVERVDGAQSYADSATVVPPEQPAVDPAALPVTDAPVAPPADSSTPPDDAAGAAGPTTQEA